MKKQKRIYLDYAATTPTDPEVVKTMTPYFGQKFGNASSIHSFGRESRQVIDDSRRFMAFFLDCEPGEIIFASGGSESDNLAIRGLIAAQTSDNQHPTSKKLHVITSQIEHHAVLYTIKELEKSGQIEATYVKPGKDGLVSVESIKKEIRDNTVLISIIYVNNEIGTVQPIREIGKMIEKENKNREKSKIYFHTDAVQASEYFEMGSKYLKVDLLTMTAHKIYGPKGVGLLFVKKGTPILPEITGGEQEYRKRAGTENVTGIIGFAKAAELIISEKADSKTQNKLPGLPELIVSVEALRLLKLRDKLIKGIIDKVSDVQVNGSLARRSPANVNVSVKNSEGEALLLNLDLEGIAASSGSACTSGALEPSHVLTAIGVPPETAHGSIRFTLGRNTTETDIEEVIKKFTKIINKVRAISPFNTNNQ